MPMFSDACSEGVKQAAETTSHVMYPTSRPGHSATFWPSVLDQARFQLLGRPGQTVQELFSGKAFSPGSHVRTSIWPVPPPNPESGAFGRAVRYLPAAMSYLGPGLELYNLKNVPKEHRGEAAGSAIGGLAGQMLGMPFGQLGTMAASTALRNVGARVGRAFD